MPAKDQPFSSCSPISRTGRRSRRVGCDRLWLIMIAVVATLSGRSVGAT